MYLTVNYVEAKSFIFTLTFTSGEVKEAKLYLLWFMFLSQRNLPSPTFEVFFLLLQMRLTLLPRWIYYKIHTLKKDYIKLNLKNHLEEIVKTGEKYVLSMAKVMSIWMYRTFKFKSSI